MAGNANLGEPIFDWNEPARVIKIDVLQDKARQLGVSSVDIASALNNVVSGATVTQLRDDIYLIDVIARAKESERGSIETLADLAIAGDQRSVGAARRGREIRLRARTAEIWRRSRLRRSRCRAPCAARSSPRPWSSNSSPRWRRSAPRCPPAIRS